MEKSILKTLIYANIFAYPLKGYEVYKWLLGKETTLLKVEKKLNELVAKKKIQKSKGYFFLKKYQGLVEKRLRREKFSRNLFIKAIIFAYLLKIIPWIKLVGISGGLALKDASKSDDIDFLIITQENRLYLSRLFVLVLLELLGARRRAGMSEKDARGKVCINTFLDENFLEQKNKDLYTAHEILQMRLCWQRHGIYSKYLVDNEWVFKLLPNWTSKHKYVKPKVKEGSRIIDILEGLAKKIQLKVMQKPQGMERIEEGGLYFYPKDYRGNILRIYKMKTKRLN